MEMLLSGSSMWPELSGRMSAQRGRRSRVQSPLASPAEKVPSGRGDPQEPLLASAKGIPLDDHVGDGPGFQFTTAGVALRG